MKLILQKELRLYIKKGDVVNDKRIVVEVKDSMVKTISKPRTRFRCLSYAFLTKQKHPAIITAARDNIIYFNRNALSRYSLRKMKRLR